MSPAGNAAVRPGAATTARRGWLGLLCLATGLVLSCGGQRPAIRNVLLISIDTLRADHVSSYGFPRPTTPNIDGLAREGVLFRNVYSPIPATLPAHSSMLTGTLPPLHGVRDNLHQRLPDTSLTLAKLLKQKGFVTGAVVSSFVLDHRFNLSQGFDSYDDRFQAVHKIGDLAERKGDETSRVAMQWLAEHARQPFFLFVHYYDPHDPYEPAEPFASEWAEDLYSGEVAFADHCAGEVLEKLKKLGLYDSTLIIVTGDHGEMLGEHGELNHGFFVYEGALRVPLVFRVPHTAARQVEEPASLVDILPTVASLLGISVPARVQGRDLTPWLTGEARTPAPRSLYAESSTAARYYGASSLYAVMTEGWKYIQATRPELYDLKHDPGETVNLIAREPQRAARFVEELKGVFATATPKPGPGQAAELDEDARHRLESLGYLSRGGGGPETGFDRSKEDPKDLIGFFRKDRTLSDLVERKKYAQARALCDEMLRERPGFADCHLQMSRIAATEGNLKVALTAARKAVALSPASEPARLLLAGLLRRQGDFDGAIAQCREALQNQPDSLEARTLLGRVLAERGSFDEALSTLGAAAASRPDSAEAAIELGFALAREGKVAEAVASYRRALALDPGSAPAHAYLGSALASQGNLEEAMAHFEVALRAKPEDAELHDFLGVALREKGRTEEAIPHFREAIRLEPGLAVAHFNLGRALKQQGALDEAVQQYRRALEINPHLAGARKSLGSALGSQGRLREAVQQFREAVLEEPADAEAHNNLGLALRTMGERDDALRHFQAALGLRPDWAVPMNEAAWILATHPDTRIRDPGQAVRLGERAAEQTLRREPVVLDTLAAAYAAAGDFDRASAVAQEAAALAVSRGSRDLAGEIGKRLELYRERKPFRASGRGTGVSMR